MVSSAALYGPPGSTRSPGTQDPCGPATSSVHPPGKEDPRTPYGTTQWVRTPSPCPHSHTLPSLSRGFYQASYSEPQEFILRMPIMTLFFWGGGLHWVFVAVRGLSLVAASGGHSLLRCVGFSSRWLLLSRSTGSRQEGFSSCGTRAQ